MVCVDAYHKKRSAPVLGHSSSTGSTIVTHTLTPYMASLLITQNSALWPSKGGLNQPETFPDRWHHGSEQLRSKDGDTATERVMKFHSFAQQPYTLEHSHWRHFTRVIQHV